MSIIGKVESLWRYPVKSMRGEQLEESYVGFAGVYGDRLYAFTSSASPKEFPYLTAREQRTLLRYQPRFRHPEKAARPVSLAEAEWLGPGLTPVYGDTQALMVDVEGPTGDTLAVDDPALIRILLEGLRESPDLALARSDRAMTDCRPVSLISVQSTRQLAKELGVPVDQRRFRANVYLDLIAENGFSENELVGRSIRIGSKVVISILELNPRCAMITLDADTGESTPGYLRQVAQAHDGMAGVYGAVLVEGSLHQGDAVELLE